MLATIILGGSVVVVGSVKELITLNTELREA
jgi:hypothetical protein